VLYLKFFEDLTNEQIAKVTKKNRRQIENQIYQAKQALRAELEKEGFSYEGL
jgi:RNA polymerase sigma-70 factor (ECF subfamily)